MLLYEFFSVVMYGALNDTYYLEWLYVCNQNKRV